MHIELCRLYIAESCDHAITGNVLVICMSASQIKRLNAKGNKLLLFSGKTMLKRIKKDKEKLKWV